MAKFFVLFGIIILLACNNQNGTIVTSGKSPAFFLDSLFGDSRYSLMLTKFDTISDDESVFNTLLSVSFNDRGFDSLIQRDSIFSRHLYAEVSDFNFDGVSDVLIDFNVGGRANEYYHLYVASDSAKKLIKVRDFHNLPNPAIEPRIKGLSFLGLSSANYYNFFRVSGDTLINLGHSFRDDPSDSLQYDRVIQSILNDEK